MQKRVVVTGAFSYVGASVANELLERGYSVHTLTNRRVPRSLDRITHAPLEFDVETLARELAGADAFVNTFWIRLPYRGETFETAVAQSRQLIEAAVRVGTRFVHVSVSNAAAGRNLGYYRGKATVEDALRSSNLSYAIVRPTLVVGAADVLTNNIAWFLRRFPIFPLPGDGRYRLQPVTIGDVGRIIADGVENDQCLEVDAAGPETFTFIEYLRLVRDACTASPPIVPVPSGLALAGLHLVEPFLRDVVLTREELLGLTQELLVSHHPPLGHASIREWLMQHGSALGRTYVNDLQRHFKRGAKDPILDPTSMQPVASVKRT